MGIKKYVAGILLAIASTSSYATVSAYADFYVPYEQIQSEEACLSRQMMEAEFGIPLASMLQGIFSPTQTLIGVASANRISYENINMLVDGNTRIPYRYNFDRYHDNGITDYSFTLDMGAFNAKNGNSIAGRQKTSDLAKLAAISIIKTAELMHGTGKFRLWLHFENLPDQTGLSGVPIYEGSTDWPQWPFTSASFLYGAYAKDVLGAGCLTR